MDPGQSGGAFVVAKQIADAIPGATVRRSDTAGPGASDDPRLVEHVEMILGRRLSQFSMAASGIRLAFWGEDISSVGHEILIEHSTLEIGHSGHVVKAYQWNDAVVATSLLAALGHTVTRIHLTDGYLIVDFDNELHLRVEPSQHYESWQISSDDDLLIVCTPGGDLTIWYPETSA